MKTNSIYFRRRQRVLVPSALAQSASTQHKQSKKPRNLFDSLSTPLIESSEVPKNTGYDTLVIDRPDTVPLAVVASALRNFESHGYQWSPALIREASQLNTQQFLEFYQLVFDNVRNALGAHQTFRLMYPNFPKQVMEMSDAELYLNAIIHYWSGGVLLPYTEVEERQPLLDPIKYKVIELGTAAELNEVFRQILLSNTSWSETDKLDVVEFIRDEPDRLQLLKDLVIPQRENATYVAALIFASVHGKTAIFEVNEKQLSRIPLTLKSLCRNVNDVLRLAVALSGGDVSLAKATKFRSFTRKERRELIWLISMSYNDNFLDDLCKWKSRWIRLIHGLHVSELRMPPKVKEAFEHLRSGKSVPTFNSQVERLLIEKNVKSLLSIVVRKPGEFARRLDHILRSDVKSAPLVIDALEATIDSVSTPVLLQIQRHFFNRSDYLRGDAPRVFFPKGQIAKAVIVENKLPELSVEICRSMVELITSTLVKRFSKLEPLGKVYIDPKLGQYVLPFSQRSASKALKTVVRGSRFKLQNDADYLRAFTWWKNADNQRTDVDLSAVLLNEEFQYVDNISYVSLRGDWGVHSGDIVNAPNGAAEFVDINLEQARNRGRYMLLTIHNFTRIRFVNLPECYAGWMMRLAPQTGKVFEPSTVQMKFDITSDTEVVMPFIVDLETREVIWADLSLKSYRINNVGGSAETLEKLTKAMVYMSKPGLLDLLHMHAQARGKMVSTPEEADVIFSEESGIQFEIEKIASEFMA